jgi:hypothetical protein
LVGVPEADEWWHQEDADYPPYHEVLVIIRTRVQEVCITFST